jgi:hypothetical protein
MVQSPIIFKIKFSYSLIPNFKISFNYINLKSLNKTYITYPAQPKVNIIKLFGVNLLTLFCKPDLFIAMQQMLPMFIKGSSL